MSIFDSIIVYILRWWQRAGPGGVISSGFFILVFASSCFAQTPSPGGEVTVIPGERRQWTAFRAYMPEKTDYALELGSMWETENLYWIGGQIGFHVGHCLFSKSETCQQYVDAIAGAGGRDGQTNGMFMAALRWQFIDFPKPFSPSIRVLAGLVDLRDQTRDYEKFAYGIGYGWTASVHERLDLSLEIRVGGADEKFWSQAFLGIHIKAEKWLTHFKEKMQKLGGDAARILKQ